jgi:hypothetical protein
MIIPKDEAEAKQIEALVKQNEAAGDWVSEDPLFSPLQIPKKALDVLKRVGAHRLPSSSK